jgi:hypothetical protein
VHVAGARAVVCATKADVKLSTAPVVAASVAAGEAVRAAISRELKVPLDAVRITSVRPARAGDRCVPPKPAGVGSIVEARVGGKTLRYYRDEAVVLACDPARK